MWSGSSRSCAGQRCKSLVPLLQSPCTYGLPLQHKARARCVSRDRSPSALRHVCCPCQHGRHHNYEGTRLDCLFWYRCEASASKLSTQCSLLVLSGRQSGGLPSDACWKRAGHRALTDASMNLAVDEVRTHGEISSLRCVFVAAGGVFATDCNADSLFPHSSFGLPMSRARRSTLTAGSGFGAERKPLTFRYPRSVQDTVSR